MSPKVVDSMCSLQAESWHGAQRSLVIIRPGQPAALKEFVPQQVAAGLAPQRAFPAVHARHAYYEAVDKVVRPSMHATAALHERHASRS